MKTHNNVVAAGALALALSLGLALPGQAQAAVGTTILNEGFDDINALEGWSQFNGSYTQGQGWFQGVASTFAAQGGAGNSYAAANYLSAENGVGIVSTWLISPLLELTGTTVLSFFSRAAGTEGFSDQLEVRFDDGTSRYNTLLVTVGGLTTYPGSWTGYSASVNQEGAGRFAFRYVGDADALEYIGIDTVSVMTAVPEPSSWLMLVLGLVGVAALRRQFS